MTCGLSSRVIRSGMIQFPSGHARNNETNLHQLLLHKFRMMGCLALPDREVEGLIKRLLKLETASPQDIQKLYAMESLALREPLE